MEPLVNVVMNCYNCEQYLEEAIQSVLDQEYKSWEIIFWDNASTDSSSKIVKKYTDKRIKYFKGNKNVAVSQARNFALDKCNADFVAFLDCDDIWLSDKLSKQMPLFKNNDVGLVFSNSIFFKNNGYQRKNYNLFKPVSGDSFLSLLGRYHLDIETVIIRRDILIKNNLYFHTNINYMCDAHLFIRVAYFSKTAYVPHILAKWRIHEKQISHLYYEEILSEYSLMYDDIFNMIDQKNLVHIKALEKAKAFLILKKAYFYWGKNGATSARKILKSNISFDIKSFLIYISTFIIPFKLIKLIVSFVR